MKKAIYLLLFLVLCFITSCDVEQVTYINNIKEENYVVTWDKDIDATLYYVQVSSTVTESSITFTTNKEEYNLKTYITDLQNKHNGFILTVKVKSNSETSVYKNSCEIVVEEKIIELEPAPTPSNLLINGTVLSWNKVENVTNYKIEVTYNDVVEIYYSNNNNFDFIELLKENGTYVFRVLAVKSESYSSDSKYSNTITYNHDVVQIIKAPTPKNVSINNTTISWDNIDGINSYEIIISNGSTEFRQTVNTNSFNFDTYLIESNTYTFKVKALKSNFYNEDSDYSNTVEYIYEEIQIEKEILNYDFTKLTSLPSGASATKFEQYADKSLKLSSSGAHFTTPIITAYRSFSVKATIKGNNCSGNGVITIYGLDASNKVVEKQEFAYTIENTKHELNAEFTSTDIVKVKFEYTTKDKGNVGLYTLIINHDEEQDKLTNIELINYNDTYTIGSIFDYNGKLLLTYKSGKKEEIVLSKDLVTISNFSTTTIGTYTANIKYLSVTGNFTYTVVYEYEALYNYADSIEIYTIDLNNESNNIFTILSIRNNDKAINILFDYNNTITLNDFNVLKNELSKYIDTTLTYYYSVNNKTLLNQNNLIYLDNEEYNFAPDLLLLVNNDYYEINIYGYSYYFAVNNLNIAHKVDVLQLNGNITKDDILTLDPEHIILQEGNIDTFMQNGILVYQTDNEIYQYAPTINKSFYYSFNKIGFNIEGNNTELSSTTIWSDSETLGLHHNTQENYLYRKSYYGDIDDLYGEELILALRKVTTDTHTYLASYGDAKTMLTQTDKDPLKPGFIIMTYTSDSIKAVWDQGITWNREHIWPKSLSGGLYTTMSDSSRNAGSDLHHIRPALTAINSSRGNKMYGSTTNELTFYPGDDFIGDTARILFYLSVRYDMSITGLKVCEDINLLLTWNNTDSVDNLERNRNSAVQSIQGNYNPFIDNPWLADRIWG